MSATFAQALIEERGNQRLGLEEKMVLEECRRRGIPTTLFTAKRIQRRQLPLTREVFVCGDMDAMHGAMKQLGIEVREPHDYPECLAPWFHRRVWRSTLGGLEARVRNELGGEPVFAKPAGRQKIFTGRVFTSWEDLYEVASISRQEPLWCSEVVAWQAEFRVYVIGTGILSVDRYAGEAGVALDLAAVQTALEVYRASAQAPAAYGIDFGVLSSGETALVEANDGYALGAYQIDAAKYTDLLFARWRELLDAARTP